MSDDSAVPIDKGTGNASVLPEMTEKPPSWRSGEGVFTALMLVVSLVVLFHAYDISGFSSISSAGAFPMLVAAIMVVSMAFVMWQLRYRIRTRTASGMSLALLFLQSVAPSALVIYFILTVAYVGFLDVIGFLPASAIFIFAATWLIYRTSIWTVILVSGGSLIGIYAVFRFLFHVALP
jgi:hypothetical protein